MTANHRQQLVDEAVRVLADKDTYDTPERAAARGVVALTVAADSDLQVAMADLLADLMHTAAAHDVDFEEALTEARELHALDFT